MIMYFNIRNMKHFDKDLELSNEICIEMGQMDFEALMYFIDSPENRKTIIQNGVQCAQTLIDEI